MGDLYKKYGTSRAGSAMAAAGAAAGLTKGIIDGISNSQNFCLDPGKAAANAGENFAINLGNIFGGLGDVIKNAIPGGKTPLEEMQNQVTDLNNQYRATFDNFTTSFASAQASFDEDIVDALQEMNTTSNTILTYFRLIEDEKIEMNLNDSVSPVLIQDNSDKNSYYVIMPMKI